MPLLLLLLLVRAVLKNDHNLAEHRALLSADNIYVCALTALRSSESL